MASFYHAQPQCQDKGLGLQFDFRTSWKVKLTWQNYIPMVKW